MENIWLVIGFTGQAIFGSRFVIQWIYSERKKRSEFPLIFWYLSIIGSCFLLAYAFYRRDIVFILGFSLNMIIYIRNLILHQRSD